MYRHFITLSKRLRNVLFSSGKSTVTKTEDAKYYLAGSISFLTFIVYLTSLRNEFLLWDDDLYITDNTFIRSFNGAFLRRAFFDFSAFNWHPLTWLSHALDYAVWGLNPLGHHLTNSILHAANTFLVVFVLLGLFTVLKGRTQRTGRSEFLTDRTMLITAGVTSLLFGLHPIHVESVAWVAERKDVLCALFFLLSIMVYTKYVSNIYNESMQQNSSPLLLNKQYLLSFGLFVLALLSKPMAVTLPVVLLVLDWYPFERIHSRETFRTAFVEKFPFIAFSLVSSLLTILAQKGGGAIKSMDFAPLSTRLLVGAKSLIVYLWKMMMPMDLIPYYLYPKNASLFSLEYASAITLVIGITIACIIAAKKQKVWLTAWGYYLVTLVPVLGIVQVGSQAMADRYSYLPSLGPFVLVGLVIAGASTKVDTLLKGRRPVTFVGRGMALVVMVLLIYLTVQQIGIWRNSIVFWNYIIDEKTQKAPFAYISRGMAYEKLGQTDKALADYDTAIALDPSYVNAYNNRAIIYDKKGQLDKAFADYDKAIALNPSFDKAYSVYNNRALLFEKLGQPDKALADFDKAIASNPSYDEAYYNRALLYEKKGQLDKALADYDTAIVSSPSYDKAYYNRAIIYDKKGQTDKAVADYDRAITINPSFSKAYLGRGIIFIKAGLFDKALEYINKSITLDHNYAESYGTRGLVYTLMNRYDRALEDFNKALALDPNSAVIHFNRGYIYEKTGKHDLAFTDFQKACKLGNNEACNILKARQR